MKRQSKPPPVEEPYVPSGCWLLRCCACGGELIPDPNRAITVFELSPTGLTLAWCSVECCRAEGIFK